MSFALVLAMPCASMIVLYMCAVLCTSCVMLCLMCSQHACHINKHTHWAAHMQHNPHHTLNEHFQCTTHAHDDHLIMRCCVIVHFGVPSYLIAGREASLRRVPRQAVQQAQEGLGANPDLPRDSCTTPGPGPAEGAPGHLHCSQGRLGPGA